MHGARTLTTTVASLMITFAVLLSGTHAKDLATFSLPALWLDAKKQADDNSQHIVKVAAELHSHVDKTVKVQVADTDNRADHRSLRLLHQNKRESAFRSRLSDRLRLWWQISSLYLS